MASAESLVRSINRRLSEIEKYFGSESFEFHRAKNVVWQELGGGLESLLKYDKGRVSISRSKRVISEIESQGDLYEIVQEVWNTIRGQGTVREMANQYMNYDYFTLKELQNADIKETIAEMSRNRYRASYVDDDIYDETDDLLAEEAEKLGTDEYDEAFYNSLKEVKEIFRERGSHRDYKYARAEQMLQQAKAAHEEFLVNRILENSGEPADMGENE